MERYLGAFSSMGMMEWLMWWNDWYYGTTGIMERLVLWNDWYYGTTGIMERLVSWNDYTMERFIPCNDSHDMMIPMI